MEEKKEIPKMLELMSQPGFCVKENIVTAVNSAASKLFVEAGTDVRELILENREAYEAFREGCLYLTLSISGYSRGAAVIRIEDTNIFLLDPDTDSTEFRSLALAALELRSPLNNVMTIADQLLSDEQADPQVKAQLSGLNRGFYQMLRIISNMSDAGRTGSTQVLCSITSLLDELFQKADVLAAQAGIRLTYSGLQEDIYSFADREQLERAIFNILSNAIKFTPKGGTIQAELSRTGSTLRLSILDSGSGIAEDIRSTLFQRYLRQPGIEDSRHGLGLGMVLVRNAAASHGGTVLVDHPEGAGTRVTLTLAIRQNTDGLLRSPSAMQLSIDYAGGRDHGLVELSDCLPADCYDNTK